MRSQLPLAARYLVLAAAVVVAASLQPACVAAAQDYPASASVRLSSTSVRPGGTVQLEVTITLDPGWHTYDLDQPEFKEGATQITLEPTKPIETSGGWSGTEPQAHFDEILKKRINLHNESPTWSRELRVPADTPAGQYKVSGKVRFQACNEFGCRPPREDKFQLVLEVNAVAGASPGSGGGESVSRGSERTNDPPAATTGRGIGASAGADTATPAAQDAQSPPTALPTKFNVKHTDFRVESIWAAIGFGFFAGMILNVMPCVLPVISLKIYGFVKQAGEDRRRIRQLGLAFGAGILCVFLIFAVLFAFAGMKWGELFQSDTFNVAMVAVLVACSLWMFEVFVLGPPEIVGQADAAAAARKDLLGEFAKGMLATLLSTPCSGPLLIPVISFALGTNSPPVIFSTLTAVGVGMAFPYVVLAWNPGWMKRIPKPGDWMTMFKEFMGFLLLATAVWLLWSRRKNGELVVWTVAFSVFVGLAGWLYGRWSNPMRSAAKRYAAPIVALLLIVFGAFFCFSVMYVPPAPETPTAAIARLTSLPGPSDALRNDLKEGDYHWQPFNLDAVMAARAKGQTVVVDWTADW